jgi:hypothetical protein
LHVSKASLLFERWHGLTVGIVRQGKGFCVFKKKKKNKLGDFAGQIGSSTLISLWLATLIRITKVLQQTEPLDCGGK